MVDSLLQYKKIDLEQVDKRKLHAGFRAIDNKSKEDSESILKILLRAEPKIVRQHRSRSTRLATTRACSLQPLGKGG